MSNKASEDIWNLPISSLTGGALEEHGFEFVHQLLPCSERELGAIPRIGKKGIAAIKQGLAERGLSLRPE